jgi:hypothetical protein
MIQFYYPKTIKNVTVALMDMFNDLVVYKYTSAGTSAEEYSVPILFGPVEKEHLQRIEDHEYIASATDVNGYKQVESYGQRYWISTPRLALTMNGIAYNAERAYGVNEWREWFGETVAVEGSNLDDIFRDYAPAPYDINYTLHIMTDSMDYFAQIMENILPYFNPALFLRVKEFSFLNIERDLKVTMPGVNPEFISSEISDDERRQVNGTMDLTVEAWMYRPFERSSIIKIIDSKYFVVDASSNDVSAMSADNVTTSALDGWVISADYFSTSGFQYTSAGDLPTSAIPVSGTYSFSGDYLDDNKHFVYFTSADGFV